MKINQLKNQLKAPIPHQLGEKFMEHLSRDCLTKNILKPDVEVNATESNSHQRFNE